MLSFPLDLPTPLELASAIRRVRRRLIKRGVQASAPTCILGHSLGGVAAQTLLVGKQHFADCGAELSSIVDIARLTNHSTLMDDFSDTETDPDEDAEAIKRES